MFFYSCDIQQDPYWLNHFPILFMYNLSASSQEPMDLYSITFIIWAKSQSYILVRLKDILNISWWILLIFMSWSIMFCCSNNNYSTSIDRYSKSELLLITANWEFSKMLVCKCCYFLSKKIQILLRNTKIFL